MMKTAKYLPFTLIAFTFISSCKKGPGTGGKATITGKVYEYNYNNDFSELQEEYYKGDHDVYIIYGDQLTFSDDQKTNYDGTFEFKYLLPGKYTIFTYSADTNLSAHSDMTVLKEVELKKDESLDIGLLKVFDL